MIKKATSPLGKVYLTLEVDNQQRWILADWQGYLTVDNIREGARICLEALAESGFDCVLNDARAMRGPWDHSLEWALHEWAPQAARAGLRYFAMVLTPEALATGSATAFYNRLTAFQAQVFDNLSSGRAWLQQVRE